MNHEYHGVNPCFTNGSSCKERYLGCHSRCEKYLAFRSERDEANRLHLEEQKMDNDFFDMSRRRNKYKAHFYSKARSEQT